MSNPFTPDFGKSPAFLVGREQLRAAWEAALSTPGERLRTALLLSPRGTGKTAMLNEIESIAAGQGMLVIVVDTSTSGLTERIAEQIEIAHEMGAGAVEALEQSRGEVTKSARINLWFASAGWEKAPPVKPQWSLRRTLTHLAAASASLNSGMLLSVDELHAADPDETRRLAADLQHVAKRENLPLCFVGAALPFFRGTLRADRKLSFFNRCAKPLLPRISDADAADFYRRTVASAGGSIAPDAVGIMAARCDGNAYKMQLIGHSAWTAADAPRREIAADDVHEAVEIASGIMHEDVFRPLWEDLAPTERRCLERLAGTAEPLHIAEFAAIESDSDALSAMLSVLVDSGCADYDQASGTVSLGPLGDRDSIAAAASVSIHLQASDLAPAPPRTPPACGRPMPRVPGVCVLTKGHSGRCRSKL